MGGHDHCCGIGCHNRRSKRTELSFYRFPAGIHRRGLWINVIRRNNFRITQNTKVCSVHFVTGKPVSDATHIDYIPTQHLGYERSTESKKKRSTYVSRNSEEWSNAVNSGVKMAAFVTGIKAGVKKQQLLQTNAVSEVGNEVELPYDGLDMNNQQIPVALVESLAESAEVNTDHCYARCLSWEIDTSDACMQTDASSSVEMSTQTTIDRTKAMLCNPKKYIKDLQCQLHRLKEKAERSTFSACNMLKSDKLTAFWTGLPSREVFDALFVYLAPKACNLKYDRGSETSTRHTLTKTGRQRKLKLKDEFFAVLVRLRVGLLQTDIAQRLGISEAHFSKIFSTWIRFLRLELSDLSRFPSLEEIGGNMPPAFLKYPNTRIIIDCTEIYVEKPSSLKAQRETWSNYKHNNTYKVLVGIVPDGTLVYLSKLYGGCVSDKRITHECGLIDLLNPGDSVMADRGFDISDMLRSKAVGLNIPPFVTAKDAQLTSEQVEETRRIAEVRIHVERAIQRIKSFKILQRIMPLCLHMLAEEIFLTCAYLTNFQTPIINS